MANFVRHESCPKCGSRDNLGRYSDGSAYCFGCKYYEKGTLLGKVSTIIHKKEWEDNLLQLPTDAEPLFPTQALEWLHKYGITDNEIVDNSILWSEEKKCLIFPYYDPVFINKLVYYCGRRFSEKGSKYYSRGKLASFVPIHSAENDSQSVVICEDAISAIKISRVRDSCPLFGCIIRPELLITLSKTYHNLIIWLDPDKQAALGPKLGLARALFKKVKIVKSDKDPKDYSMLEIMSYLSFE